MKGQSTRVITPPRCWPGLCRAPAPLSMKRIGAHAAVILALAGAAHAADVSPGDIMVTKAPSPAAATAPAACGSLWDFIVTSCPLSWYGITVYGVVDAGVTWQSHGTPFNRTYVAGEEYLISKNSNRCGSANRQAHNKAEEASRDKPRARRDKGREDSAASNKMIKPKACSSGQEPKANPPIKRVWTARPARQCLATAKAMA